MNRRHKKLEQVIEERGADPKMEKVPGGKTGLLVRELKTIGVGKDQQIIQQFSVDGTLLKSALELETAAAKELGQLNENASASLEVTVKRIIGIEMSML
jgi:hypothetical protein